MSQEAVLKVLSDIAMADSTTYWVVGALSVLTFLIMRSMLPVKGLSVVFAPFIFWGGLAGVYVAKILAFVPSTHKTTSIVIVATIGMIAALVLMMLLTHLFHALARVRTPPQRLPARIGI